MVDVKYIVDNCPFESGLQLINRKWLILIVKDIYSGKNHFNQFKESNPELSNKVLSNCLKYMEEKGFIIKIENNPNNKFDTEYQLTDYGKKLNKIIYELAMFNLDTDKYYFKYNEDDKEEIREYIKKRFEIE